ncbi:MAG: hypothetical protein RDU20_03485 [Desulfomonilaceae bacterium]|nr:hypothetical protein [Desulfomonilaceae bacterium]
MKHFVTLLLLIMTAAIVQPVPAVSQTASIAAALQQVEAQLQTQLERIKHAREAADQSTSLAKMRIARELLRSEAEMERQIEILERLKEQMQDQTGDSPSSLAGIRDAWNSALQSAISGLAQQIQSTAQLLSRMESFREKVEDGSEDDRSSASVFGDGDLVTSASGGASHLLGPSPCSGQGTGSDPAIPTVLPTAPSTCPFATSWTVR